MLKSKTCQKYSQRKVFTRVSSRSASLLLDWVWIARRIVYSLSTSDPYLHQYAYIIYHIPCTYTNKTIKIEEEKRMIWNANNCFASRKPIQRKNIKHHMGTIKTHSSVFVRGEDRKRYRAVSRRLSTPSFRSASVFLFPNFILVCFFFQISYQFSFCIMYLKF